MWRTDGRSFLGPRGMAEQPPGEESCGGRCGRTIAAQPVSDQTSPVEDAVAAANQARRRIADKDIGGPTARRDRLGQFSPPASSSRMASMRSHSPSSRRDVGGRGRRCDPGRILMANRVCGLHQRVGSRASASPPVVREMGRPDQSYERNDNIGPANRKCIWPSASPASVTKRSRLP